MLVADWQVVHNPPVVSMVADEDEEEEDAKDLVPPSLSRLSVLAAHLGALPGDRLVGVAVSLQVLEQMEQLEHGDHQKKKQGGVAEDARLEQVGGQGNRGTEGERHVEAGVSLEAPRGSCLAQPYYSQAAMRRPMKRAPILQNPGDDRKDCLWLPLGVCHSTCVVGSRPCSRPSSPETATPTPPSKR